MYIYIFVCFNIVDYSTTSRATYASILETFEAGEFRSSNETFLAVSGQRVLGWRTFSFVKKMPQNQRQNIPRTQTVHVFFFFQNKARNLKTLQP